MKQHFTIDYNKLSAEPEIEAASEASTSIEDLSKPMQNP